MFKLSLIKFFADFCPPWSCAWEHPQKLPEVQLTSRYILLRRCGANFTFSCLQMSFDFTSKYIYISYNRLLNLCCLHLTREEWDKTGDVILSTISAKLFFPLIKSITNTVVCFILTIGSLRCIYNAIFCCSSWPWIPFILGKSWPCFQSLMAHTDTGRQLPAC